MQVSHRDPCMASWNRKSQYGVAFLHWCVWECLLHRDTSVEAWQNLHIWSKLHRSIDLHATFCTSVQTKTKTIGLVSQKRCCSTSAMYAGRWVTKCLFFRSIYHGLSKNLHNISSWTKMFQWKNSKNSACLHQVRVLRKLCPRAYTSVHIPRKIVGQNSSNNFYLFPAAVEHST